VAGTLNRNGVATVARTLDLHTTAFLLDVDGTIIDIAPTPDAVTVAPGLPETLLKLAKCTDGAVALISGRRIADLDRIFAPLALPGIGGHGVEIRTVANGPVEQRGEPLDGDLRRRLAALAAHDPGLIVEDKGFSVAVHYRLAPHLEASIRSAVAQICSAHAGAPIDLLPGKAVIEVKRAAFDKGVGLRELMGHPPFRSRRPVFIGDDVTDEAAFAVLPEFDGIGLSVGRVIPGLAGHFESPSDVRHWLAQLAEMPAGST
jgi:trehalose 6-phosphate phosphatase